MNMSLGVRLKDGRRVGIEWRRRRVAQGTVLHVVLRHSGELSPDDFEAVMGEIASGERLLTETDTPPRRRRARA